MTDNDSMVEASSRRGSAASAWVPDTDPLLTDLYQLTMVQAYLAEGLHDTATFELFVRKLPPTRNFLVAAGLETAIAWIEALQFDAESLEWLARQPGFDRRLLDWLAAFRFTGDVDALPEGTVFFADEPLLRVTAPLPQAQLLESRLINLLQFQTVVASKAARCVLVAGRKRLVDFGMRRAHAGEAAMLAARASYIAGFDATSNVAAGRGFGIPVAGTMAHSYVLAHRTEADAFRAFTGVHPHGTTLLIDTWDTEAAARLLVDMAPSLQSSGVRIAAVRLDSGDLAAHARAVRDILDAGGLSSVGIFASGGLDEHEVERLVAGGAPIDGFGVGTAMVTSEDAPALDCAYKLVAFAGQPRRKHSEGKANWPAAKQVFRRTDARGRFERDVLALADEAGYADPPLLRPVVQRGRRVMDAEPLAMIRTRAASQLEALPDGLRTLAAAGPGYRAAPSEALRTLVDRMDQQAH